MCFGCHDKSTHGKNFLRGTNKMNHMILEICDPVGVGIRRQKSWSSD
jgi:hypothetical protein